MSLNMFSLTNTNNFKLNYFLSVLYPSLILFSYLGRGIYNSTLFIFFIFAAYILFSDKRNEIVKNNFFRTFLFFILIVFFTIPFSNDIAHSAHKYISFILSSVIVIISGLYLYVYSEYKKENVILTLYVLFISSIIMEIVTIIGIYNNIDPLAYIKSWGELVIPMSNNYHLKEIFTASILPLGVFLYYLKPSKIKLFFIIIAFVGILASTSRAAMLCVVFSLFVFILVKNRWRIFNKEFVYFIFAILISCFLAFELSPEIQNRVASFKTTFDFSNGDRMSGRYSVYEESYNRFKSSIFVGHGIKDAIKNNLVIKHKDSEDIVKHPHNIWLELLMDTGIVGFIAFLPFVFYLSRYFYLQSKEISLIHKATIMSVLTSIFLSSLVSWSIWSGNQIGPMLIIILIIYSLKNIKVENIK